VSVSYAARGSAPSSPRPSRSGSRPLFSARPGPGRAWGRLHPPAAGADFSYAVAPARSPAALGSREPLAGALSGDSGGSGAAGAAAGGWMDTTQPTVAAPFSADVPRSRWPGEESSGSLISLRRRRARRGARRRTRADAESRDAGRGNGFRLSSPARREPPCRGTREVGSMLWIAATGDELSLSLPPSLALSCLAPLSSTACERGRTFRRTGSKALTGTVTVTS
jgi:hypothetical protein